MICITFLFVFICVSVQKLWYPKLPGHCIDQVGTWIANAASAIMTDLAILTLPLPRVWKLKLRRSRKIAVLTASLGEKNSCVSTVARGRRVVVMWSGCIVSGCREIFTQTESR